MKRILMVLAASAAATLTTGCGDPDAFDDEMAPADDGLDAEESAAGNPNGTYFMIEQDMRRCPSPMCGGVFVDRVNHDDTLCLDGTTAATCYAAKMDLSHLTLATGDEAKIEDALGQGELFVRGRLAHKLYNGVDYGKFVVTEAWFAGTGHAPAGRFYRETSNGLACLVYPCNNIDEGKLNSHLFGTIADLDFTPSGATQNEINEALDALYTDHGLMIAGFHYTVSGQGGTADARKVREFYTLFAD